jgi:uncharacterized protein (TIGR02147 family)
MAFSVYHYTEFPKLLEALKRQYPGRQKPLSFEQLAEKIGYNSPRLFAMVINRQRLPSSQLVSRIAAALNLDSEEQSYLDILRTKEKLTQGKVVYDEISNVIAKDTAALDRDHSPPQRLELEEFAQISEWYYPVLKHLIKSRSGERDFDWLCRKLADTLGESEIRQALDRMLELDIIKEKNGKYTVTKSRKSTDVGNTVPSLAIKRYHAQAMQCAVNALYRAPMERREYQSLVIGVNDAQVDDAKKFIRSFIASFRRKFGDCHTDRVCRLNVQFFEHTDTSEPF